MAIDKTQLNWLSKIGADTVPLVLEMEIALLKELTGPRSIREKLKTVFLVAPYITLGEVLEDLSQWNFEANGGLANRQKLFRKLEKHSQ